MKLHDYFRSSASYRVRIALALKGLEFERATIHLLRNGGEQHSADFGRLHPARLVPVLEDGGEAIGQSLAIMEYLEETHPEPPLLPESPADRAWVRQIASAVACDIHPLNNLRVLRYLAGPLALDESTRNAWARHWIGLGLGALEARLSTSPRPGLCCFGDAPTMADACLVPQLFNARRFDTDLSPYPRLRAIEAHCLGLPAFERAHPSAQPDAE